MSPAMNLSPSTRWFPCLLLAAAACSGPRPSTRSTQELGSPTQRTSGAQPGTAGAGAGSLAASTPQAAPIDVGALLDRARVFLAQSKPQDALEAIDQVLADERTHPTARTLHGVAMLQLARVDGESALVYADALHDFEAALAVQESALALAGASRAARMAGEPDKALDFAQRAQRAAAGAAIESGEDLRPAKLTVEAAFDVYLRQKQSGGDSSAARTALTQHLDSYVAHESADTWALVQRANLCEWEQDPAGAAAALEQALVLDVREEALHNRLVAQARAVGQSAAVLAAYDRIAAAHPKAALPEWYRAQEYFSRAAAALQAGSNAEPDFVQAERHFAACREREPGYQKTCHDYEIVCRGGVGWARLAAEDLAASEAAFRSMVEIQAGGLEWSMLPSLRSGVDGLAFVADAWQRRGDDPENLGHAARLFEELLALRATDAAFANNAGFFHREAAVGLEFLARRAELAAKAQSDPTQLEQGRARAEQLRKQARDHVQRSLAAYREAIRRAPTDVRYLNDCALIMVYHAREHADEARKILHEAIALGQQQLADLSLDAGARDALQEAWGDAHQNMGLLDLLVAKDAAGARTWFQKCFEIGPKPRVNRAWVTDVALGACDRVAKGETLDVVRDLDPRLWQ